VGRTLVVAIVCSISGAAMGYFLLGKWRALFAVADRDGPLGVLLGVIWRVALHGVALLGVPILILALLGLYPLRPLEVIVLVASALICSSLAERVHGRRRAKVARAAGLLSEEDL